MPKLKLLGCHDLFNSFLPEHLAWSPCIRMIQVTIITGAYVKLEHGRLTIFSIGLAYLSLKDMHL